MFQPGYYYKRELKPLSCMHRHQRYPVTAELRVVLFTYKRNLLKVGGKRKGSIEVLLLCDVRQNSVNIVISVFSFIGVLLFIHLHYTGSMNVGLRK